MADKIVIHWFRRDLRLEDNHALYQALKSGYPVMPIFIFDREILDKLEDRDDRRVSYLHHVLSDLQSRMRKSGSELQVYYGQPRDIFKKIIADHDIHAVYVNEDYEPYAQSRDDEIAKILDDAGAAFHLHKDHVVFAKDEVTKDDGNPYVVFTPYSKKWRARLEQEGLPHYKSENSLDKLYKTKDRKEIPSLALMGFEQTEFDFPDLVPDKKTVLAYSDNRNFPAIKGTTRLGVHLRFGTISVRRLASMTESWSFTFVNELCWRDFYSQILWHFPHTVDEAFRPKYDTIPWRSDEGEFEAWCKGETGYELVDAGMRELRHTGFMHNRVRMLVASFLTKHLLLDWRLGERHFARYLMDFDLASNVGGWQWAAGCGTDAAPYFRIFNPESQLKKFDKSMVYCRKWIPEIDDLNYINHKIVDHKFARQRALDTYKAALNA